jgi:3-methyladenine DNA glycosylase AlkD
MQDSVNQSDRETAALVDELDRELRFVGDAERAVGAKAYLKSDLEFIGVPAKPLRAVARAFLTEHLELDRTSLTALVRALWDRPVFELRSVAVALLERRTDDLETGDLSLVEELLRRSHTWALVDWLCTKVASPLVDRDPAATAMVLERWSTDDDFWVRRASMLAQLPALRAGGGDFELFASFASRMVEEKEFFIRKAIGWVLRDVSKKRPELAYGFLRRHIGEVSGLTLREGSKYLPENQRESLRRARR